MFPRATPTAPTKAEAPPPPGQDPHDRQSHLRDLYAGVAVFRRGAVVGRGCLQELLFRGLSRIFVGDRDRSIGADPIFKIFDESASQQRVF